MFARRRPQSSGSAQFCGILSERLLAPVSDEKKKHEAAEATAETRAERNGWPDAKIERTDGMRVLSSMFVAEDRISDWR